MASPQVLDFDSPKSIHSLDSSAASSAERRRVNPESLAERLGAEVVAELEKHIVPGELEMPSFTIRRNIQVKYGVDRRHIYDFYHSRGLRCLRNERGSRKKDEPAVPADLSRSRSSRGLPVPNYTEPKRRRSTASPYASLNPKLTRGPRKSAPAFSLPSTTSSPPVQAQTRLDVNRNPIDNSAVSGSLHENAPPSPAPSYLSEPDSISSFSTASSLCAPLTPLPEANSDLDIVSSASALDPINTGDNLEHETFDSIPESCGFLSREEQLRPYAWLSSALGPAEGIQECVGSYKQFMERQRNIYYEPFFDIDALPATTQPSSKSSQRAPVVAPTSLQNSTETAPTESICAMEEEEDMVLAYPSSSPSLSAASPADKIEETILGNPSILQARPLLAPPVASQPVLHQPVFLPPELLQVHPAPAPPASRRRHTPLYRPLMYPGEQVHTGFFIANQDALRAHQIEGSAAQGAWEEGCFQLHLPSSGTTPW